VKDNDLSQATTIITKWQLVGWGELANLNKNKQLYVNVGVRSSPQPTQLQYDSQVVQVSDNVTRLEATQHLTIATKITHSGWELVFNIAIDSILNLTSSTR
jgi:hypothetical protein